MTRYQHHHTQPPPQLLAGWTWGATRTEMGAGKTTTAWQRQRGGQRHQHRQSDDWVMKRGDSDDNTLLNIYVQEIRTEDLSM